MTTPIPTGHSGRPESYPPAQRRSTIASPYARSRSTNHVSVRVAQLDLAQKPAVALRLRENDRGRARTMQCTARRAVATAVDGQQRCGVVVVVDYHSSATAHSTTPRSSASMRRHRDAVAPSAIRSGSRDVRLIGGEELRRETHQRRKERAGLRYPYAYSKTKREMA